MSPKSLFVGPLQGEEKAQSFVQRERSPEPSNHISAIALPMALACAADNKNIFKKSDKGEKGLITFVRQTLL